MELFGRFVHFAYAIWDRIVLRGYYERLQRPANIVYFFRDVCGVASVTPAVLARRTEQYRKWVEGYARRRGVKIFMAPKGIRKEEFVEAYFKRFRPHEGVVVILKSIEQASTFVSYEPRFAPPSGDDYRVIKRASAHAPLPTLRLRPRGRRRMTRGPGWIAIPSLQWTFTISTSPA